MTAPEPMRKAYWTLQVTVLVIVGVGLIAAGIAWDGGPLGFAIGALCLALAVVVTILSRRKRL